MADATEAFLGVVRTASSLLRDVELLLNRHGLTGAQYNVLRILRGAGEQGACGREIASKLITAEPDIARLLDRMEKHGLISRTRDAKDRRFVTARITPSGLETLAVLDEPVADLHRRQFAALSPSELKRLVTGLEKTRPAPLQSQARLRPPQATSH